MAFRGQMRKKAVLWAVVAVVEEIAALCLHGGATC